MSLSDDDSISPANKRARMMSQEQRKSLENPFLESKKPTITQEHTSFLSSKETEKQSLQDPYQNPNHFERNNNIATSTGNLHNTFGGNFGLGYGENLETGYLQRDIGQITMIPTPGFINEGYGTKNSDHFDYTSSNDGQKPPESLQDHVFTHKDPSMTQEEHREIYQQSSFLTPQETSVSLKNTYQAMTSHHSSFSKNPNSLESNFGLGSGENMESRYLQRDFDPITMIPTPGIINSSTNDKNNNGEGYAHTSSSASLSTTRSSPSHQQPEWTITKILTKTDAGDYGSNRLLLNKSSVEKHIQKHIPEEDFQKVVAQGQPGLAINVFDYDTKTTHKMRLTLRKDYILVGDWIKVFIKRRDLKAGDEIGLLWDSSASRLQFGVLKTSCKIKKR
ncbi:hypothetical protein AALP_AA5G025900 [Arabis alpina]|uniref:TF-B3 domain-containing protein n=1 Tax=Arabis alpina TaxID=50452 RepID=A0A087GUI2_ARAAL|nr:hypothetical protein AALP_AA5G025900 [Arabis alpina]